MTGYFENKYSAKNFFKIVVQMNIKVATEISRNQQVKGFILFVSAGNKSYFIFFQTDLN